MLSGGLNEDSSHSSIQYLQGVAIMTSKHQQQDKNKSQVNILHLINQNLFNQSPIVSNVMPSHQQRYMVEEHPLLRFITRSSKKISHQTKKKIIKIRNKNLNYFVKNTHDRDVMLKLVAIKKYYKDRRIKDPTKSHVFSFICLALLRKYAQDQSFFNIFNNCETIRKNKRTLQCTRQEIDIIKQQMEFFKSVAKNFYINPLRGILLMYLRNHSEVDINHNQLDQYTVKGLHDTIGMLNSRYFMMRIDDSFIGPFLEKLIGRNHR